MAGFGRLESFDESDGDWPTYIERLNNCMNANDVPDNKRVVTLLSQLGGKTYALIRDLTAPDLPSTKTFIQLITILTEHLSPQPLVIAERFRFYKRNQEEGESVLKFVAELKRLTKYCEFGNVLNESVRDRFVCGLRNEQIQERLLTERDLTLTRAVEVAVSMETASRDAEELSGNAGAHKLNNNGVGSNQIHKVDFKAYKQHQKSKIKPPPGFQSTSDWRTNMCRRCDTTGHAADNCRFKTAKCRRCGRIGHIQRACKANMNNQCNQNPQPKFKGNESNSFKRGQHVNTISANVDESDGLEALGIYGLTSSGVAPIFVNLICEGQPVQMELDTGAAVSIMSQVDFKQLSKTIPKETNVRLKTYTGECFTPVGLVQVTVSYQGKTASLPLYIVESSGPPLFGRNWLSSFNINLGSVKQVNVTERRDSSKLQTILDKHAKLFTNDQGTIKGFEAKIRLEENAVPKFLKARPVPFAIRKQVEDELESLVNKGVLTPVETSEWATPIVPIMKKNNTVRLCGDYKVTINPVLVNEQYPMPKAEEVFATLAGGKVFSKLDLTQAYQQMALDEESKKYLTLNTHKGLFQQNRLPFGITSAPSIFQRSMEQVLQGQLRTVNSQDDILISGTDMNDHLNNLDSVLQQLEEKNVKLNLSKCKFLVTELEYLGHVINAEGLHTTKDKVEALIDAPTPKDVTQLRSFLGLLNYYHKFLPDISTVLHPLHELLQKDVEWKWTKPQEEGFVKAKELVGSARVLVHYDPELPVTLACDASSYGLGVVLSHQMPDGSERPIAFASRSLTKSEKNYAQVDREALAIVYGTKKFHQYVYGRHFTLITDHLPLMSILGPKSGIYQL